MTERPWFAIRPLEPGITLIAEPMHVNSFLVTDADEAVLLDTGLGLEDINMAIAPHAEDKVRVVNTHHHFDHIGGNHLFESRAIHETGAPLLDEGASLELMAGFGEFSVEMYQAFDTYEELDREYFGLLDDVSYMRPLPEGFDPATWTVEAVPATELLREGDIVECGRHRLRVVHTPGHSPDSVCLFDEYSGALFCGDTVNTGPMLAELPTSDLADYQRSTRRLADELAREAKVLYMCHGPRYWGPPTYLEDVARAFEAVVSGEAYGERILDFSGNEVVEASFGDFSIIYSAR